MRIRFGTPVHRRKESEFLEFKKFKFYLAVLKDKPKEIICTRTTSIVCIHDTDNTI